jgi:hypothetical protein
MANAITWYNDSNARVKEVYYEGASTIHEGMALCYNFDTTDNWTGYGAATAGASKTEQGTTAEGEQNEGKYIRVEDPSSTNFQWLAGFVCGTEQEGKAGPCPLRIYIPNGAVIPVRAYASCTAGTTVLGLTDGETYLDDSTGDDDPIGCALAMETVDRSSVAGLVLAKVWPTGQVIVGNTAYFLPSTYRNGRCYGVQIDGSNFFGGAAGAQEYLCLISGYKETAGTGDNYGGLLYINGGVNSECDANCNWRGLNVAVKLCDDATAGHIYGGNISLELDDSAGNITDGIALQVDALDKTAGTKTNFGAVDISICREGTAASTDDFGVRLRTRGEINTAINTAFKISKDATDHGFINLFNIEADAVDYAALSSDITWDSSDKKIPIVLGGVTYYLVAWAGS